MASSSSASRLIPVITASTESRRARRLQPRREVARGQLDDQLDQLVESRLINRLAHPGPPEVRHRLVRGR